MFAYMRTHAELDLLKWLMLIIIAGALALLLVGTAIGTDVVRPPGLLPPEKAATAMPLPSDQSDMKVPPDRFGLASEVWRAIELQKTGNIDEAIGMWEGMRLPAETDHWRLLMLGVAHMQNGDEQQAAKVLAQSQKIAPENPVVYYTLGLLWLGRADRADEWYDAIGIDPFRTAGAQPEQAPQTRSMYRLAATMAFERAVQFADRADLRQPLLPGPWRVPDENAFSMTVIVPCVTDALEVFGGERFEGRSHLALGLLQMQCGALGHAEQHLDEAAELGEPTGDAFHDLGELYEEASQSSEAMRAHLKAFSHGGGAANLQDAWRCFGRLFSAD